MKKVVLGLMGLILMLSGCSAKTTKEVVEVDDNTPTLESYENEQTQVVDEIQIDGEPFFAGM